MLPVSGGVSEWRPRSAIIVQSSRKHDVVVIDGHSKRPHRTDGSAKSPSAGRLSLFTSLPQFPCYWLSPDFIPEQLNESAENQKPRSIMTLHSAQTECRRKSSKTETEQVIQFLLAVTYNVAVS